MLPSILFLQLEISPVFVSCSAISYLLRWARLAVRNSDTIGPRYRRTDQHVRFFRGFLVIPRWHCCCQPRDECSSRCEREVNHAKTSRSKGQDWLHHSVAVGGAGEYSDSDLSPARLHLICGRGHFGRRLTTTCSLNPRLLSQSSR